MKELDVLFERFLADAGIERLDAGGLDDLERLLECADADILGWVMARECAPDAGLQALVVALRGGDLAATVPGLGDLT